MSEKTPWIDKVLDKFIEEIETPPSCKEEHEIQRKVMTIIQYRANGVDHRRMGLLAADMYRLIRAVRARVVEDMAKIAACSAGKDG